MVIGTDAPMASLADALARAEVFLNWRKEAAR